MTNHIFFVILHKFWKGNFCHKNLSFFSLFCWVLRTYRWRNQIPYDQFLDILLYRYNRLLLWLMLLCNQVQNLWLDYFHSNLLFYVNFFWLVLQIYCFLFQLSKWYKDEFRLCSLFLDNSYILNKMQEINTLIPFFPSIKKAL